MSNCSCCCINTLNFCERESCGELDLDIKSQVAGVHKLITHFQGRRVTLSKEFDVDEEISFSLDGLNEKYEYTAELYDPDGTKIIIKKGDIEYDCFKFKTVPNVTVAA